MKTADLTEQRWFGSKSQDVADVSVLETVPVDGFELAIVEVAFHPGTHELYQLALRDGEDVIGDPDFVRALVRLMDADSDVETEAGSVEFRHAGEPIGDVAEVRPLGAEHSNTSICLL
jgi:maltokinase